tara:strand:- start:1204 stop:1371 length:168 start_codon:yes stop_codon:yes gene_type:complete
MNEKSIIEIAKTLKEQWATHSGRTVQVSGDDLLALCAFIISKKSPKGREKKDEDI